MRRLMTVLAACLCLVTLQAEVARADGNDSGSVGVKGHQGKYEGRFDVSRKRSHQQKHPGRKLVTSPRRPEIAEPKLTKAEKAAIRAICRDSPGGVCPETFYATPEIGTAKLVRSLSSVARTLIVRLQLPDPTPRFGPDPSVNEWKMAAVGFPLWLWTDGPTTVTSRARAYGVTFTLRATWQSTTFDMGDGHQVTCTSTSVYPRNTRPARKSPNCGYTYLTSSLPKGNYQVTATTNWLIEWSALGQSGSLPGSHTGSWSLPVGELNALVVR